jgi:hypothetical protein
MNTTETAYEWHVVGTAQTNEQAIHLSRLVGYYLPEHPKVRCLHRFSRTFSSRDNAVAYLRAKAEEFAFDEENLRDLTHEIERSDSLTWAGVSLNLIKVAI